MKGDGILENRYFAQEGVEIWLWHNEWLVLCKVQCKYGKFYPQRQYGLNELFDVDPLLRRTFHGVNIKSDPSPLNGG